MAKSRTWIPRWVLAAGLLLSGCAVLKLGGSAEIAQPNAPLDEKGSLTRSLSLAASARLLLIQRLRQSCTKEDVRDFSVRLLRIVRVGPVNPQEESSAPAPGLQFVTRCEKEARELTASLAELVEPGSYALEIRTGLGSGRLDGAPFLLARFRNPDANSGPGGAIAGARALPASATVREKVDYNGGNRTHWFVLTGRKAEVGITFESVTGSGQPEARLYRRGPHERKPTLIRTLEPGIEARVSVRRDDFYLRVQGAAETGETPYTLRRRELR